MAFCTSCGTPVEGSFCQKCGQPVAKPAPAPAQAPAGFGQQAPPQPAAGFGQQPPQQPVAGFGQQAPPPAGTKKKMGPLGWVLIGLAGFFLLIGALVVGAGFFVAHKVKNAGIDSELASKNPALAAAKLMVSLNPEVEVVKVDDEQGVLTIREKKTGKTITMNADDVKNGRITFSDDSTGEKVQFGAGAEVKLPSWVPEYPGSKPEGTMAATGRNGGGGMVHFTTSDSVAKVLSFYQDELKSAGFKITSNINGDSGDSKGGLITAENSDSRHTVMVTVGSSDNGTQVAITYGSK
ncbi:hypothetical protein [uncultured Paludibaculum sp.]|uniref:hypothetical protein n=1 Tax=uncultured Paludibaculum sp. TaxID=1765020 RepID=UPI002AABBFA3|nr:hypothetical protein [uncultured Paludibaculum sp.]